MTHFIKYIKILYVTASPESLGLSQHHKAPIFYVFVGQRVSSQRVSSVTDMLTGANILYYVYVPASY